MQTVKVTTDNKISVIDVDFDDVGSIRQVIGGDFELVKTQLLYDYFRHPIVVIVDEEGLIKDLPLNYLGSFFYGTHHHGHPIVGDLILAVPYGEDLDGLWDAEEVKERLMKDFTYLEEE